MANTIRTYLLESLRGFYERLPLKKVAVDGSVLTPDVSGVVDLGTIGNSPWEPGDGENSAVLKDTSSYATGVGAVAHGDDASAFGLYSHAEGIDTIAYGNYSHAEGESTTAVGNYSHAEGAGSYIGSIIFISGDANAISYTTNIAHGLKVGDIIKYNGIIARVTAINTTKKFTVDHTLSDVQLTNASGLNKLTGISYGAYSHAEGQNTTAFAAGSHAEGQNTTASGQYSHAEGYGTKASSDYSHAEGYSATASGQYSHAEGYSATASVNYSHAEGRQTTASGTGSHAEGNSATASGLYSHAEGNSATASGSYSHAEGNSTTASGNNSHAEGQSTSASGDYSHAEGQSTTASGINSHVEGHGGSSESLSFTISGAANATTYTTNVEHDLKVGDILKYNTTIVKVSGFDTRTQFTVDKTLSITKLTNTSSVKRIRGISYSKYSHAEGENTTTSGYSSHAEGTVTTTSGDYSHAEGRYTYTSNAYEHAQGSYNMSHNYNTTFGDNGNTLNSIGVGVSDASRSNVIEVMQNGDVYVKGVGSYDGSNYVDASTLQEVINSGGGSADSMTSITYANLKNLRDTSSLVPGMQYRIRDYQCTTVQPDTSTAGHQFDIIVTADSEIKLNENARAAHHDDDTYFAACKLEAWELKYSLDNDTDRFTWADTSNGKGVIYYMKDEWNNECPYDFKNIKFQRWAITADQKHPRLVVDDTDNYYGYYYGAKDVDGNNILVDASYGDSGYFHTFALKDLESGEWFDYTVIAHLGLKNEEGNEIACYNNHLAEATEEYTSGNGEIAKILNNIVFFNCYTDLSDTSNANDYSYCNSNSFLGNCLYNTFGNNSDGNSFGNMCLGNTFGNDSGGNSFGYNCNGNTFGNNCNGNIFGNMCQYNTFTGFCLCNTFGNGCTYNSFKDECNNNSFGNDCGLNIFGNYCQSNTFGNSCNGNTFGNDCNNNSFRNSCSNNSFGDYCSENSLGDYCSENLFGDYFQYNSFGNYCFQNLFTSYFQAITVFDCVQNCSVTGGTQQAAPVKNAQILNGTAGASRQNRLTIAFTANKNYTQVAAKTTAGVLKIYNPADLVQ